MTPFDSIPDGSANLDLLTSIVANSPLPIYFKDLSGVYLGVNAAFISAGGHHSADDVVGHTDLDFYPEPVVAVIRADDLAAAETGDPVRTTRLLDVDGEERTFETVRFPMHDSTGAVVGVCGIAMDVSDSLRVQDDEEVQRQRAIFARPFVRRLATLTPQEARIANFLALGYSDKHIAEQLSLTPDTVRHHVSHVLTKLDKASRTQVVIEMLKGSTPTR